MMAHQVVRLVELAVGVAAALAMVWAALPGGDRRDDDIMLSASGVGIVEQPGDFSWMADAFNTPEVALAGHVPGVNVLYLDGHAGCYEDTTEDGTVLYNNGMTNWRWEGRKVSGAGAEYNWLSLIHI